MANRVRKNDIVQVMTGDHKGARGKVLRVDLKRGEVVVEGVNIVFRHVRPTRRNPQGGRIQKEAPLHLSNVLPYDAGSGRGRRARFEIRWDDRGSVVEKKRVLPGGTVLHSLTPPDRRKGRRAGGRSVAGEAR